jgi:hypothetical protein
MEKINMTYAVAFPLKLDGQQEEAARMLLHRPDIGLPSDQELDKLLECQELPDCLYGEGFGFDEVFTWFDDVPESISWWMRLANLAMEKPGSGVNREYSPNPKLSDRRKELSGLLARAMEAVAPANDEMAIYGMRAYPLHVTVDLMRRYRLYTRQVEALLFEVWQGINKDLLTKPEFFKGPSAGTGKPYIELVA